MVGGGRGEGKYIDSKVRRIVMKVQGTFSHMLPNTSEILMQLIKLPHPDENKYQEKKLILLV